MFNIYTFHISFSLSFLSSPLLLSTPASTVRAPPPPLSAWGSISLGGCCCCGALLLLLIGCWPGLGRRRRTCGCCGCGCGSHSRLTLGQDERTNGITLKNDVVAFGCCSCLTSQSTAVLFFIPVISGYNSFQKRDRYWHNQTQLWLCWAWTELH